MKNFIVLLLIPLLFSFKSNSEIDFVGEWKVSDESIESYKKAVAAKIGKYNAVYVDLIKRNPEKLEKAIREIRLIYKGDGTFSHTYIGLILPKIESVSKDYECEIEQVKGTFKVIDNKIHLQFDDHRSSKISEFNSVSINKVAINQDVDNIEVVFEKL